jgi:hypothetical protein
MKHFFMTIRIMIALIVAVPGFCSTLVTLDTSSLVANPNGPFILDFQFSDGSGTGDGNNTVTISNFSDPAALTFLSAFGGAVVNPGPLSFSLTDNSFFTDIEFTLTPDTTLSFDFDTTLNSDPGTPDTFIFDLLDRNLNNVPTLNLNNGIALLEVDLPTTQPAAGLQMIASASDPSNVDGVSIGAPSLSTPSSAPEPSTFYLVGLILLTAVGVRSLGTRER